MKIKKKKFNKIVNDYENYINALKWENDKYKDFYHCWKNTATISMIINTVIIGSALAVIIFR